VIGVQSISGSWAVTVEDSQRTRGPVGGLKPPAGSDFLTVDVVFQNKGADALRVRAEDFKLVDPGGAAIPLAKTTKPAFNASSMRPLLPGFGTSTVFVYAVPAGSKDRYTLTFSPPKPGKKSQLAWRVP
jgi:hypothetical protein